MSLPFQSLEALGNKLQRLRGAQQTHQQRHTKLVAQHEALDHFVNDVADPVIKVLREAASLAVVKGTEVIASYLTKGLTDVFGEGYEVSFRWKGEERKSLEVIEKRPDGTEGEVTFTSGDSTLELLPLVMRILALWLWRGQTSPVCVVNEETSNFHSDYSPRVYGTLRQICNATGVQVIIVSHSDQLMDAHNVVYVWKDHGGSHVESIPRLMPD